MSAQAPKGTFGARKGVSADRERQDMGTGPPQQVKVLATKPDNKILTPETHMMEAENRFPQAVI